MRKLHQISFCIGLLLLAQSSWIQAGCEEGRHDEENPPSYEARGFFQGCANFTRGACSSVAHCLKHKVPLLLILSAKTALDVMNIVWTLDQMDGLNQLHTSVTSLNAENCPELVCISNAAALLYRQGTAYRSDAAVIGFAGMSALADAIAMGGAVAHLGDGKDFLKSLDESVVVVPMMASLSSNALGSLCGFIANGALWDSRFKYLAAIPETVRSDLSTAMRRGAGALIPQSVFGLPAMCMVFVAGARH